MSGMDMRGSFMPVGPQIHTFWASIMQIAAETFRKGNSNLYILKTLSLLPRLLLLKPVYLVTSSFEPISPILFSLTRLAEKASNILYFVCSAVYFIDVGVLTSFFYLGFLCTLTLLY